jgi:hypothetical protein
MGSRRLTVDEGWLGWVAGVFDLKALLYRKNNKTRVTPQLVVLVDSRDPEIIATLAALTGCHPMTRAKPVQEWMSRGCTEHCPEAHVHHEHKWSMPVTTRWSATGVSAAIILNDVLPYMRTDRGMTGARDEAIANTVLRGPGAGAVRAAARRLIGLGWQLPPQLADKLLTDVLREEEN